MAMPSEELAMVDANILVYAFYDRSEYYAACSTLLHQSQGGILSLCITSQVLAEFYAVITDSRRVTEPYEPKEALDVIGDLLSMPGMSLLSPPVDVVNRWITLARNHTPTRGAIFDFQLAATMLGNGVRRIYTFDRTHFERFEELEVLTP